MTDPIDRIDVTRGLERKDEKGRFPKGSRGRRRHEREEGDNVEISSEARERALRDRREETS